MKESEWIDPCPKEKEEKNNKRNDSLPKGDSKKGDSKKGNK